jgi:hypothetical protein
LEAAVKVFCRSRRIKSPCDDTLLHRDGSPNHELGIKTKRGQCVPRCAKLNVDDAQWLLQLLL